MPDMSRDEKDIAQSDRRLAEGRVLIRRQIGIVRDLRVASQPDDAALRLLRALRDAVAAGRAHRSRLRQEATD
jgi:hypothetical protein